MAKKNHSDKEVAKIVANMSGIKDIFFERLINDPGVCEEFLQTILKMPKLKIKPETLIPQKDIKFIANRSVRVDAYVEDIKDKGFNVEVQRADNCNHRKRARYNASALTVYRTYPSDEFDNVQDLYIIYLTENDFLHKGKTIYHAEMIIKETGEVLNDGLHEIFINTECDDGSKIARLMKLFKQTEVDDSEFPNYTRRFNEVKNNPEEEKAMCKEIEAYAEKKARAVAEQKEAEKKAALKAKDAEIEQLKKQLDEARALKTN